MVESRRLASSFQWIMSRGIIWVSLWAIAVRGYSFRDHPGVSTAVSSRPRHHSPLSIPSAGPSWEYLPAERVISTRSVDWIAGGMLPLQRYKSVRSAVMPMNGSSRQVFTRNSQRQHDLPETENTQITLEQIVDNPSDFNLSKTSMSMLNRMGSFSTDQRDLLVQKILVEQQASQPVSLDALEILYCDAHICVTNKPSGVLSVPGPRRNPSLANLVYDTIRPPGMDLDQMVVHRLDMATSGILVYALSLEALSKLHVDFKERNIQKTYQTLVAHENSSILSKLSSVEGEIDVDLERDPDNAPFMRIARPKTGDERGNNGSDDNEPASIGKIGSDHKFYRQAPKESFTTWTLLSRETFNGQAVSRLELHPWTGRTHQLRVHCAQALGAPIVGDDIYGGAAAASNSALCLHARQLCMYHPISGAPMIFEADPPF